MDTKLDIARFHVRATVKGLGVLHLAPTHERATRALNLAARHAIDSRIPLMVGRSYIRSIDKDYGIVYYRSANEMLGDRAIEHVNYLTIEGADVMSPLVLNEAYLAISNVRGMGHGVLFEGRDSNVEQDWDEGRDEAPEGAE